MRPLRSAVKWLGLINDNKILQRSDRGKQLVVRNKNLEMQSKYLVDVLSMFRE